MWLKPYKPTNYACTTNAYASVITEVAILWFACTRKILKYSLNKSYILLFRKQQNAKYIEKANSLRKNGIDYTVNVPAMRSITLCWATVASSASTRARVSRMPVFIRTESEYYFRLFWPAIHHHKEYDQHSICNTIKKFNKKHRRQETVAVHIFSRYRKVETRNYYIWVYRIPAQIPHVQSA